MCLSDVQTSLQLRLPKVFHRRLLSSTFLARIFRDMKNGLYPVLTILFPHFTTVGSTDSLQYAIPSLVEMADIRKFKSPFSS